jgi:L-alanine-DL-glutamate epimerase-like enolase superfamily enzyme
MLDGILPAPRGLPQIEVTFDIDANGILNVSAKDKGTGKEQKITITASSGLNDDEVDQMVRDAEEHAEEDRQQREKVETRNAAENSAFAAEKLIKENEDKIPAEMKEDINGKIAAVRAAIGPEVELFTDANNAWPDATAAIRAIRRWEEYDLGWVEEPNPPDELAAHAAVAAAVEPPIATGEIHQTRWDFQHILDLAAAAILQPDAAVCGGITEFRRIAALAAGRGVTVAPHWLADLHVHLVAATPNATWVEFFPDTEVLNLMEVFQTRLEVCEAGLAVPQEPGHGVVLDDAAVERYSRDGWR